MHPGDHPFDRRRDRDEHVDDEHKGRDPYSAPTAWKLHGHVEQPQAFRPLPALSSFSVHSGLHDRRRSELFPSEHKGSPTLAPLFPSERRPEYAIHNTEYFANPFGHDRRQYQYQHHLETQSHSDARPVQQYRMAEAEPSRMPIRAGKASLAFILDHGNDHGSDDEHMKDEPSLSHLHLNDTSSRDDNDGDDSSDTSLERYTTHSLSGSDRRSPPMNRGNSTNRKSSIKRSRICKVDGCTRYVVNKGLCIGHGGGKRCAVAGCTSSAKNMGVCWKHGGSTKCTVENCENRAKSRGVCWSHGGGRKCKEDGCAKTAVSNGLCWAHGGGKRCIVDGCKKPAYERNGNLCTLHKSGTHASTA